MWHLRPNSTDPQSNPNRAVEELLQSIHRYLVYTTGGVYLLWHVLATASWPLTVGEQVWLITPFVVFACCATLFLLPRSLPLAQVFWQVGLTVAVTLAIYVFRLPEIALFYMLLPLMAAIVFGWSAALLTEGLVIALVWWMIADSTTTALSPILGLAIIAGGAFSAMLGTASVSALVTVTQWSLFSLQQAQRNTEEARQHRAQLAQLYKDLDQAYYRLDRANSSLVAARKEAEAAEHFKAEFVSNVSHELRTPLNLIVGFTEMMLTAPENYDDMQIPGPYRSDLDAVHYSAQHLLALVDDVLDLARIEAGKFALSRERVELDTLVTGAVDIVKDYVQAKRLQLEVKVEPGLPALWIDRLRIRQVLLNLLVNAARHTERGGIGVDMHRQGQEVIIRVTDTGQGILEADLPKIFEEFRSTEQPVSQWHSGTGLGLPISKKFVELHHGRIGVESTYGKGSCFWFTLPFPGAAANEEKRLRPSRYRPSMRLGSSERIVVVVHDDPHIASLLKRFLSGYQVIGATDPHEGRLLAQEFKAIALIIGEPSLLPAVADAGLVIHCPLPSTHLVARDIGAQDLLVKPVSRHELLMAIDRLDRPIQRALVVDDDPDIVRLFRRMLQSRIPYQDCLEAYNGAEALQVMRTEKLDLVLLDLVMPEVDGSSVLAQMAKDPELSRIPVILISARGQDHVSLRLSGPIQITKEDGFELGDIVRTLDRVLSSLAPGWDPASAMETESEEAPAATTALAGNPRPPTSAPR